MGLKPRGLAAPPSHRRLRLIPHSEGSARPIWRCSHGPCPCPKVFALTAQRLVMVKDEMVKTLSAGEKHVAPVPHLDSEPLGNSDGDSAYFSYYAQLQHQAQMLQDSVRTSAYQHAILYHAPSHFRDKIVMDVGAGNGILSLFALQAGANKVFAVEASAMVRHLQMLVEAAKGQLADKPVDEDDKWYLQGQGFDITANNATSSNAWLAERLMPVSSKVEDVTPDRLDGNRKVDTIVSECLGVLLVHERMVSPDSVSCSNLSHMTKPYDQTDVSAPSQLSANLSSTHVTGS